MIGRKGRSRLVRLLIGGLAINVLVALGCHLANDYLVRDTWRPNLMNEEGRQRVLARTHFPTDTGATPAIGSHTRVGFWFGLAETGYGDATGGPPQPFVFAEAYRCGFPLKLFCGWACFDARRNDEPCLERYGVLDLPWWWQDSMFVGVAGNVVPVAPLLPGLIVNTILYAGLLWLLAWIPFAFRRLVRRRRGRCVACGYDLTGNTSGQCPECGAESLGKEQPA